MKKMRFLALLAMAAMVSVSFIACDLTDDDPVNGLEDIDECTWAELSQKAKFLSAFPELEGKFSDASILLNTVYSQYQNADYVIFNYEIQKSQLDAYSQKLVDDKFVVQNLGGYFWANKIVDGYSYIFQCSDGFFTIVAFKFTNDEEYNASLEQYQENLKNMGSVNISWTDAVAEVEWLKEIPALTGTFSQIRVVDEYEVALMGDFSEEYREAYAKQLEDAGFVNQIPNTLTSFKKDIEGGGYYFITMNEVMIDFRNFTNN